MPADPLRRFLTQKQLPAPSDGSLGVLQDFATQLLRYTLAKEPHLIHRLDHLCTPETTPEPIIVVARTQEDLTRNKQGMNEKGEPDALVIEERMRSYPGWSKLEKYRGRVGPDAIVTVAIKDMERPEPKTYDFNEDDERFMKDLFSGAFNKELFRKDTD